MNAERCYREGCDGWVTGASDYCSPACEPEIVELQDRLPDVIDIARRLAAALALALYEGHPVYGNTTGWRGGIGGQTITQGCSFIDPPPGVDFTQHDLLSKPLREFMQAHPFDLNQAKDALRAELEADLHG